MRHLDLLLRGVLAGLAIAIPVGPVNILCISRALTKGRLAGIVSGLGAATADTFYGAVAGFSISLVINFLVREKFWIRLVGGALLVAIGIVYWMKRPKSVKEQQEESSHSDYVTTLLLTLTNPTTVLSYMAVLAALRLGESRPPTLTLILVLGIFCGSMLWWIVLSFVSSYFRDRFTDGAVVWMNRIAALAIGAFGVVTMAIARK